MEGHIKDFLLEEYKSAQQLTFHIDELRKRLTSFTITFSTLAFAGLTLLLDSSIENILTNFY